MNRRKVLVCGATGFIGRNVIERLAGRKDLEIYGTYCKTRPSGSARNDGSIALSKADLRDKEQVDSVIRGMDVVIQAAAVTSGAKDQVLTPWTHVTDNALMNSLIFLACHDNKVKHVVFFSASTVYEERELPVKEADFNYRFRDEYFGVSWTKVYLEKMCEFYSRIGNTKYTAVRHSNIYGPYDKFDLERSHVFGATIAKVLNAKNGKIVVWGDGSEERDFLYISDLVDFVERIIEAQQDSFELINVGCGSSISVMDLVEKVIKVSNKQIAIELDPTKPTIRFRLALNIEKAQGKYGWWPRVSLEEGIRKTLSWYAGNYNQTPS